MTQWHFSAHALAIDVGAVETSEVAEDETAIALLDSAMLFRHDFVEELNRIVGVTAETVDGPQFNRAVPSGCREDQPRHFVSNRTVTGLRGTGRKKLG